MGRESHVRSESDEVVVWERLPEYAELAWWTRERGGSWDVESLVLHFEHEHEHGSCGSHRLFSVSGTVLLCVARS